MTHLSRRSSLNALQIAMVERNVLAAREVVVDSMLRYVRQSTGKFTVAEYEKAAWVWNNRTHIQPPAALPTQSESHESHAP